MTIKQNRRPRHTKIIFTIGPATDSEEMLEKLIEARVDICRINMAHADHDYVRMVCRRIRKMSEKLGREIAIMMDVKGPEIRTGDVEHPIELTIGDIFDLTIKPGGDIASNEEIRSVDVNYTNLVNDVHVGSVVLIDNGLIQMEVLEKQDAHIRCKVTIPGSLTSRRHINLPGVKVSLPPLTEKDKRDTAVGVEEGIDFFALSFVREADDVRLLRDFLDSLDSKAGIIAKMEDQHAVRNLEGIVEAADALMVARGDLGIECPFETLPLIQKQAVKVCLAKGKPVIIATHMLESMITSPIPTRAEVTDVANAVIEEADCIMLSGETTVGQYPMECIEAFDKIAKSIEANGDRAGFASLFNLTTDKHKIHHSAIVMANELNAAAILAFTNSGTTAKGLSSLRPQSTPIFALTHDVETVRRLRLNYGVIPFTTIFCTDPNATIEHATKLLESKGYLHSGDKVVVVSDILSEDRVIDSVQLRIIE